MAHDDDDLLNDDEIGGTELPKPARQHMRQLEKDNAELRKQNEEFANRFKSIDRQEAFSKAVAALSEDDRALVKVEDLGDIEPSAVTAELLQVKALQAAKARDEALVAQAKAAGFEDVDTYKSVLEKLKSEEESRKKALATELQTARAGGNTPFVFDSDEEAFKAWQDSLSKGAPPDYARAEFIKMKFATPQGLATK